MKRAVGHPQDEIDIESLEVARSRIRGNATRRPSASSLPALATSPCRWRRGRGPQVGGVQFSSGSRLSAPGGL